MSELTEYVAVVDRFEGSEAVLLIERGTETVGDLVVPSEYLPSDARTQDAVLLVEIDDDGDFVDARYDPEATERRAGRTQSRFDRLAERPPETPGEDTDTPGREDHAADDESGNTE